MHRLPEFPPESIPAIPEPRFRPTTRTAVETIASFITEENILRAEGSGNPAVQC
jgi:hypothetical protein